MESNHECALHTRVMNRVRRLRDKDKEEAEDGRTATINSPRANEMGKTILLSRRSRRKRDSDYDLKGLVALYKCMCVYVRAREFH